MQRQPAALILPAALALLAACGGTESSKGDADAAAPAAASSDREVKAEPSPSQESTVRSVWILPENQPSELFGTDGDIVRDAEDRPLGYRLLGEPLPMITGKMLDGTDFSTADLGGQWTLIDVWGLWCSDCMADAPFAAALARAIEQDPDLVFLSIHTPPSAARADEAYGKFGSVEAFFDNKGYAYPTVLDADASLREALRIDWTPTYLLVAPDLTVRAFTTDLSIAGDQPVKDLLAEVSRIRADH